MFTYFSLSFGEYMTCVSFDWFDGQHISVQLERNTLNITLNKSFVCYSVIASNSSQQDSGGVIDDQTVGTATTGDKTSTDRIETETSSVRIGFENIEGAGSIQDQSLVFHSAMHQLFLTSSDTVGIRVHLPEAAAELRETLLARGALFRLEDGTLMCERSTWFQLPDYWLAPRIADAYPLRYGMTDGKRHPIRRPIPDGTVYISHAPSIAQTFRLEKVDVDRDLHTFHDWMNQKRVDHFWEESGDIHHHKAYLEQALSNPRTLPMIGFFGDEPIGYFEAYWVKEDRLAPYCNGTDFDRGMHLLIGNQNYLGKDFNNVWLPAVLHYMLLEDCRTQRLLGEPRSDNKRLIRRLVDLGFYMEKEFDFPHKNAALMVISREVFFQRV